LHRYLFLSITPAHPRPTLFPYTTLFRSNQDLELLVHGNTFEVDVQQRAFDRFVLPIDDHSLAALAIQGQIENSVVTSLGVENAGDRKSTRLNSSHRTISYAVFCLKKKKI